MVEVRSRQEWLERYVRLANFRLRQADILLRSCQDDVLLHVVLTAWRRAQWLSHADHRLQQAGEVLKILCPPLTNRNSVGQEPWKLSPATPCNSKGSARESCSLQRAGLEAQVVDVTDVKGGMNGKDRHSLHQPRLKAHVVDLTDTPERSSRESQSLHRARLEVLSGGPGRYFELPSGAKSSKDRMNAFRCTR